ncbi:MAG TPA: hypothetical protein VIR98_02165 [Candidatus Paceibacterota bacterium]
MNTQNRPGFARLLLAWALIAFIALPQFSIAQIKGSLINLSTLLSIPADGSITNGFVITAPTKVLIRVVGRSGLLPLGVTDAISDPGMTLYKGKEEMFSNDDWHHQSVIPGTHTPTEAEMAATFAAVGAFPLAGSNVENAYDSAILMTLEPGNYSVVAFNRAHGAGTLIIEFYLVP